jgi:hypothetical protein
MGIPTRGQSIPAGAGAEGMKFGLVASQGGCLAMSARTLQQWLGGRLQGCGVRPGFVESGPGNLLVYGFEATAAHSELVAALSGGALQGVQDCPRADSQYSVCLGARSFCGEFSGLTFGPASPAHDVIFESIPGGGRALEYLRIAGRPAVAGVQEGAAFTLLVGCRQILDIDAPFSPGARLLDYFTQLVPALWFLRHVFGARCWQGMRKQACFIVDDPLLRKRHGFLQYKALLEAMKTSDFAMSVAFIPWNCDRSERQTVELFRHNPSRLSLSIHGCDHTKDEFGGMDENVLVTKAAVAQNRMARHQQLTGLACDNVMIFPQGNFSSQGMAALKRSGYLAAVNSSPWSVDRPPKELRLRDVLAPAVLSYSGFPLFVRHYPVCPADFALDLFLGKPALIVQHHDYFKNGYKELKDFVAQINQLSPGIEWRGLAALLRHTGLWQKRGDGTVWVRFCTDETVVQNDADISRVFHLFREWPEGAPLPSVTLNNKEATAQRAEGGFCLVADLPPGEILEVRVATPARLAGAGLRFGTLPYRLKLLCRRHLCELRDNYIHPVRAFLQR